MYQIFKIHNLPQLRYLKYTTLKDRLFAQTLLGADCVLFTRLYYICLFENALFFFIVKTEWWEAIKNWLVGGPGNEATKKIACIYMYISKPSHHPFIACHIYASNQTLHGRWEGLATATFRGSLCLLAMAHFFLFGKLYCFSTTLEVSFAQKLYCFSTTLEVSFAQKLYCFSTTLEVSFAQKLYCFSTTLEVSFAQKLSFRDTMWHSWRLGDIFSIWDAKFL